MEWLTIVLMICAVAFFGFEAFTLVKAIRNRKKKKAEADKEQNEGKGE